MTWIIGIAPPFGYSILVSDVRVLFRRGREEFQHDCLQKIYPIGPSILGGFAGSVEIGFRILSTLSEELTKSPPRHGWSLDVISNTWLPRIARRIFRLSDISERRLGSQILLTGVHPNIRLGDSPWLKTDLYKFSAPNFYARKANCNTAMGIGCGEAIAELASLTASLKWDYDTLKLTTLGHENHARMIAHVMSQKLVERSQSGISHHFIVGIAFQERFIIAPHDYSWYTPEDEKVEVKMPQIAKGYDEFVEMSRNLGFSRRAQA